MFSREDAMNAAVKAGVFSKLDEPSYRRTLEGHTDWLEAFYAIAYEAGRKDENEECAKLCDEQRIMVLQPLRTYTAEELAQQSKMNCKYLATAIRARIKNDRT